MGMQAGEATLLRSLESLKATLQLWRTRRVARLQAYEALMVRQGACGYDG